jgi:hypothetical protein
MSDRESQAKRKNSLIIFAALLVGFGLGYIASGIAGFLSGLAPEYHSAGVITDITAFVDKNKTWPTSWDALGLEPLRRVKVNWFLDVNNCDRHDVMMSVAPDTGGFYTYPHAERQLDELWQLVLKVQNEGSNQAVTGSRL